jgi:hypothetical protein
MSAAIRQLTMAASPDHERSVHADEAASAGHQHRHWRRAVRIAGALARVLRPLRVERHVRPLHQRSMPHQRPAPHQQPQTPRRCHQNPSQPTQKLRSC